MASKVERLRKAYEFKLGKNLAGKLSDVQIKLLSSFYNSLSENEQSKLDSDIFIGRSNDLTDMAEAFAEENSNEPASPVATEESPPTNALALYKGVSETDLVDEEIDERILRILGLEDTFDIDYATYRSLLKEQSVLISTGNSKLPREEEIIIIEEFKRIKNKIGRFKIKKKTISADAFFGKTEKKDNAIVKSNTNLDISPVQKNPVSENIVGENAEILDRIENLIRDIQNQLVDEENLSKKINERKRRKEERGSKSKKEEKLESFRKNISSSLKKVIAPIQNIFDKILNTFKLLFLGWALDKLFKFIRNPENEKTVDAVFDFLGRNIGKLVLLYFLLNSPFAKIARWLGKNLIKFLVRMAADLIRGKGILKGIKGGKLLRGGRGLLGGARALVTNPVTLFTAGVVGTTILANEVTGQREGAKVQVEQKAKADRGKGTSLQGVGGVGDMGPPSTTGSLQGVDTAADKRQNLAEGGPVKGPTGVDKVKANLTDGEFVVSAPAVKKFGAENLMAINSMAGGDSVAKMNSGEIYAKDGGLVLLTSGGGTAPLAAPVNFQKLRPHHGTGDAIRAYGITKDYIIDGPNYPNYKVPTPVDATVKYAGPAGGYGNAVELVDSEGKNLALFGHFSRILVKTGDKIKSGTVLGIQGNTGQSTGAHVHIDGSKRFHEVWSNFVLGKKDTLSAESLSGNQSTEGEDQTKDTKSQNDLTLSPQDAKLANAYLQYITQPTGRGLDILPTIDRVAAATTPAANATSGQQTRVPSGSATNPNNPQALSGAARRQLAGAVK